MAEVADLIVLPEERDLVRILGQPRAAIQILGEAGRGKTARLRLLERRFAGVPYVYLGDDEPVPDLPGISPRKGGGPALLLDEAQRLPRRLRRRLFRQVADCGSSLAVASHEDFSLELESAGLAVETISVSGLEVERLLSIANLRIESAREDLGPLPSLSREAARELIEVYGDDLRSLLDRLYEDYQELLRRSEEETWRSVM